MVSDSRLCPAAVRILKLASGAAHPGLALMGKSPAYRLPPSSALEIASAS